MVFRVGTDRDVLKMDNWDITDHSEVDPSGRRDDEATSVDMLNFASPRAKASIRGWISRKNIREVKSILSLRLGPVSKLVIVTIPEKEAISISATNRIRVNTSNFPNNHLR